MTPRLRVLFVTPESHVLVIDRVGQIPAQEAQRMAEMTSVGKIDGTMVFPTEVDIPDGAEGIEVYADERNALRSAIEVLRSDARMNLDGTSDDVLTPIADTLERLLSRIEERA